MEYTIKIPENHPEKEELEKVTKALLDFLPLHSIYLSVDNNSFSPEIILTLIISDECEMDATDIRPFVCRLFKNYPQFKFTIFENRVAVEFWEEGSIYLMNHANGNKLAYTSDPDNETFRLKKNKNTKKLFRNAKKEYRLFGAYLSNCYTYSKWHRESGNYLQAAFHLHQALNYTFKRVEILLMGECLPSQSLEEHQLYLAEFYPEFGVFFDNQNEEEYTILKQLDYSFRIVRYNKEITLNINEEMFVAAITRTEQILKKVHEIFNYCTAVCKRKIKNIKAKNHSSS
jgi:hypothetical protein